MRIKVPVYDQAFYCITGATTFTAWVAKFVAAMTNNQPPRLIKYKHYSFFTYVWNNHRHGHVLTRAHIEMLHSRLASLANLRAFAPANRLVGVAEGGAVDVSEQVAKIEDQMSTEMLASYPIEDGGLAKRMKTARSMMENNYHLHAVPPGMDTGEAQRFKALDDSLSEMDVGGCNWYTFLISLGQPDRILLNLAYSFHLIPTQDRDPPGCTLRQRLQQNAQQEGLRP